MSFILCLKLVVNPSTPFVPRYYQTPSNEKKFLFFFILLFFIIKRRIHLVLLLFEKKVKKTLFCYFPKHVFLQFWILCYRDNIYFKFISPFHFSFYIYIHYYYFFFLFFEICYNVKFGFAGWLADVVYPSVLLGLYKALFNFTIFHTNSSWGML